jgi:hypothetical protein
MISNASPKGPAPCTHCAHLFHLLYLEVKVLKEHTLKIQSLILKKADEETVYRDAVYAQNRVGISDSTLLRCQRKGMIKVAKVERCKKYFLDRDVERLRREYWGLDVLS